MLRKRFIELALAALFLLLVSTVFWLTDADRRAASLVPRDHSVAHVLPESSWAWPAGNVFPWSMFYRWAPAPAFVIAGCALTVLLAGFFASSCGRWRRQAVFILLFLALGPGLVVNVLKDHVGRARPRELIEFEGHHQFTQFWQQGDAGENSSFPSGHAAIAFFVMAPWFVLRDRRRTAAAGFLVLGLTFGILVGIARILQGGHFVSDVLWSGGLLYLIGGSLAIVMGLAGKAGSLSLGNHPDQIRFADHPG